MYNTQYIANESKLNVFKNGKLIFTTRYVYPDSEWFDFTYEKTDYSLQCLIGDEGLLWIGMWNASKVGEDTREENVLKSSVTLMKLK